MSQCVNVELFVHMIAQSVCVKNKSQQLLKLLPKDSNLTCNFIFLYPAHTRIFNPMRKLREFDHRGHRKSCSWGHFMRAGRSFARKSHMAAWPTRGR